MILIKGNNIRFEMAGDRSNVAREGGDPVGTGTIITLPPEHGMMHDDGYNLHYCDLFFGPYEKTRKSVDISKNARAKAYFGKRYQATLARVDPPIDGPWTEYGDVVQIWYLRAGEKSAGGKTKYYHIYGKENPLPGRVILYKCGEWYKISHPSGCRIDDQGIASP